MSKTKYVDYGDRGFWVYDVALDIFLKHLIDVAKASDEAGTPWLSAAIADRMRTASIADIGLSIDPGWLAADIGRSIRPPGESFCYMSRDGQSLWQFPMVYCLKWPMKPVSG